MSMGNAWNDTTPASTSKKNITGVISGTGSYLAGLDKTKFKILVCTSTGSGFTADHVYLCSADGSSAIDITQALPHTHSGSTDGGSLIFIYKSTSKVIDLQLTKTDDLKRAQWIETVTSTGTIEDNTDGTTGERAIRLRTNGTSGATATISYPHHKLDFSLDAIFQTKLRIEDATSCAAHTGVGADDTSAADSNTRKFQAEFCTTTNNNWWLRTATGSAQSASDSGIAISANRVAIDIIHTLAGTPTDTLYVNGTAFNKTSDIATSGSSADNNVIKHSMKNNTAADRPLLMYGSRLAYTTSASWGH